MKQIANYGDIRQLARCVYCGSGAKGTRDHVPSKVLLDMPYPENLPVVPSCSPCNSSFSLDEEYLACLTECTLAASADPEQVERENVRDIFRKRPSLRARLSAARNVNDGATSFRVDVGRVHNVVLKLARGHAAFELNEPQFQEPDSIAAVPLPSLDPETRAAFEDTSPGVSVWPEVGSRAMQRLVQGQDLVNGWIVVQEGRYRFRSLAEGAVTVRVVLSEYLACEVIWPTSEYSSRPH